MSESGGGRIQSAWKKQSDLAPDVDRAQLEANVRRRQGEVAKRDRIAYLSAAIIMPSYVAVIGFMPDLRPLATVGLVLGVWVTWQRYQRSGARLSRASTDLPCLDFQRALLKRERDFARSLPKWILAPLAVGQLAIVATLATNPRFTASQFFPEGLWLFVGTAGAALVIIWRRWQREALELQREIDGLGVVSENQPS